MIIGGKRGCGKTTELIRAAHKNNLYIICANSQRADNITKLAREMELSIPFPVTVDELPLRSNNIKEVLIDDMEDVLSELIGKPVLMASTSMKLNRLYITETM